ncbi:MAG TPA: hypothetical protein VK816_04850 [Jatrophihabitantaceae bacterium]|jgi:hypothetical protein|nr:hypothetical protein [Jatrophihabitantaceae bacterium]
MPGNLAAAVATAVMPQNLCTLFSESRIFPLLSNTYHDGTPELGLITDGVNEPGSIRTWKLAQKLSGPVAIQLREFFEGQLGGLAPFYWYNPFEAGAGEPIGSNYDPTGAATEGRHTVVFLGNWSETIGLPRTDVPLGLAEID